MTVSPQDIERAARRIRGHVRETPVMEVAAGTFGVDVPLILKLELLQHTGSFKPRGAFNNLLTGPIPPAGVVAASGGNHGIAVAYAASRLGVRARIFVPKLASPVKVARIKGYGAEVTVEGDRMSRRWRSPTPTSGKAVRSPSTPMTRSRRSPGRVPSAANGTRSGRASTRSS